jgi:hypothetical protein
MSVWCPNNGLMQRSKQHLYSITSDKFRKCLVLSGFCDVDS